MRPTPGIHYGISNEAYHTGPGLSHSGLKRFRKTPMHYKRLTEARDVPAKEPTASMFNGTLVHCALLEPHEFDKRYAVGPKASKSSKAWKDWAALVEAKGLEAITQQQHDAAKAQAQALRDLPEVAELMQAGAPEVTAYWHDPATNVLCKCRPDWVSPVARGKGAILLDVKTAQDASDDGFARAVAAYGYHQQADWYCRGYALASGLQVHGMVFATVESEFPYAARVFMLSDEALARAREENREALNRFAECQTAGAWPGYPPGITTINLPRWA